MLRRESPVKLAATLVFVGVSKKGGSVMKAKKCPVCHWEIKEGGIKVKVGGQEITVCCNNCAQKAKKSPAKYAGAAR